MLLFVDILKPFMLFIGGCKFKPLPLEISKYIFLSFKDLAFQ
jgi:hypothetical protein